jgi:hypothetical protein
MRKTESAAVSKSLSTMRRIASFGLICAGFALSSTVTGANAQSIAPLTADAAASPEARASAFRVSVSPSSGPVGTTVTITVSGLDGTGRVDLSNPNPIGSLAVTGQSVTTQTQIWTEGRAVISAEWIRFQAGVPNTRIASATFETTPPRTTPSTSTTTTSTTSTTTTVVANPLPNPVFFTVTGLGWRPAVEGGTFTSWQPGSGGGTVTNSILSGTRRSFDARLVFDGALAAPGRTINLTGLPVTMVDRASLVVPSIKMVALASGGRVLATVEASCLDRSSIGGPGVFTCPVGPLVTPPKTVTVRIVLSSTAPLHVALVPSSVGGPLEQQVGIGGNGVASAPTA